MLAPFFAAARADDPVPSGDLMARIMADAATMQAVPVAVTPLVAPPKSWTQSLYEAFGGWAGASTLAACVGLGLFIGFSSPDIILDLMPGTAAEASDDTLGLYFDTDL